MEPLRVLISTYALDAYGGTQTYVLDLARRLLRLGHRPVVHTSESGPVADRLRLATVPVVEDLAALGGWVPDVMHCHHTLETILALLHFPSTPAVYVCHDWSVWFDQAPPLPRIVRHVAVDETCRDRLELVHGVPGDQLRIVPNWVDLARFRPRGDLPGQPERALVFSNYARPGSHLGPVREACSRLGIPLDVIGLGVDAATSRPEDLLGAYDLVFAKAKCALEAMAVGAAVVLCDARGLGPMVTSDEFDRLRRLNFGARSLQGGLDPDSVLGEVKRYDPADAALVSARVRAEAGLDTVVDQLVELYREAIVEGAKLEPDPIGEGRVLAAFLRPVSLRLRRADAETARLEALEADRLHEFESARQGWESERRELAGGRDCLAADVERIRADLDRAGGELAETRAELAAARSQLQAATDTLRLLDRQRVDETGALRRELDAVSATLTFRLRARILQMPVAGRVLRLVVRLQPR